MTSGPPIFVGNWDERNEQTRGRRWLRVVVFGLYLGERVNTPWSQKLCRNSNTHHNIVKNTLLEGISTPRKYIIFINQSKTMKLKCFCFSVLKSFNQLSYFLNVYCVLKFIVFLVHCEFELIK